MTQPSLLLPLLQVLLLASAPLHAHTDIAMLPCRAGDPQMLWTLPPDGKSGQIVHQLSGFCVLMKGCSDTLGQPVVLDDCAALHKSGCLSGHHRGMNSDKWIVGEKPDKPLAIISANGHKYVIEASTELGLSMNTWVEASVHQQWSVGSTVAGPRGPGHTLTLGTGVGICSGPTSEPCCMTVHHDIVPDGDGGWGMIALLLVVVGLYLGVGVAIGKRRGLLDGAPSRLVAFHPHWTNWMQLHGLVQDGMSFSRARMTNRATATLGRGRGQGPYQPVATGSKLGAPGDDGGRGRRSSSSRDSGPGKMGGKSKRSSNETKTKVAKATRNKKDSKGGGGNGAHAVQAEPAREMVAEQGQPIERLLQEERSAGLHSSQQAIKVVGLNG